MNELLHVAALGGLIVLLARLSLTQWGGGVARHPVAVRVRRRGPAG